MLPYIVDLFKKRMDEFGNELEVVSYPGRKHYLGEGNEKYATNFDEEIMERTDAFPRQHGVMPQLRAEAEPGRTGRHHAGSKTAGVDTYAPVSLRAPFLVHTNS